MVSRYLGIDDRLARIKFHGTSRLETCAITELAGNSTLK